MYLSISNITLSSLHILIGQIYLLFNRLEIAGSSNLLDFRLEKTGKVLDFVLGVFLVLFILLTVCKMRLISMHPFLFCKKNICKYEPFEILELLVKRCHVNSRQYLLLKLCVS